MRLFVVLAVVGRLVRFFALAFVPPLCFAAAQQEWGAALHFGVALVATVLFGFMFASVKAKELEVLHRAEALAVVSFTWLVIAFFGAIPYVLAGLGFVDALFESMSGFTTTGATILTDFSQERWGQAFFLWRAMSQWIGGMGVIALFVVVLPRLGIAGRQLFFAEASRAPAEAVSPQLRHAARQVWTLYIILTVFLFAALMITGMPAFDAVCTTLSGISAGGFSPHPESIMGYGNDAAEWVLTVFMLLAGTSFPLMYLTVTRRPLAMARDEEFRFYLGVTVVATAVLAVLLIREQGAEVGDGVRLAAFQAASLISGTGYASEDYDLWGEAARTVLIFVMLVGGCAGSTAGGPKAIRHLLVGKHIVRELKRVLHPRAVVALMYKRRAVSDDIMRSIFMLVALFMGAYFAFGMVLVFMGHDMVTAFSASVAIVGNIGPAFNQAGPMGSFAVFGDVEKILMILGMWVGRLEILTVIALTHWHVWRDLHWRRFKAL